MGKYSNTINKKKIMFRSFLSRIINIFNIIILKIKKTLSKILLIIQIYYYNDRMPQILMILYRFIHGLIILISYIKFNPEILFVFLENYSQIPNINMGNNSAKLFMSNVLPLGIATVIPSDITSDTPPSITNGIPSNMLNIYHSGITNPSDSGIPTEGRLTHIPQSMSNDYYINMTEAESNRRIFEEIESKFVRKTRLVPDGPVFYFEKAPRSIIYPEMYHHHQEDKITQNYNKLRIYTEKCMTYSYCTSTNISDRYCIIVYPDGTSVKTNDAQVVYNHLHYHQKHLYLHKDSPMNYVEYYKQHFESIKNESINNELVNTRKKIGIIELLNAKKK